MDSSLIDKINKPHAGIMGDTFGYLIYRYANIIGKHMDCIARFQKQGILIEPPINDIFYILHPMIVRVIAMPEFAKGLFKFSGFLRVYIWLRAVQ
jgi:hypothetical protein